VHANNIGFIGLAAALLLVLMLATMFLVGVKRQHQSHSSEQPAAIEQPTGTPATNSENPVPEPAK